MSFDVAALTDIVETREELWLSMGSPPWAVAVHSEPRFMVYLWFTKRFSWRKLRKITFWRLSTDGSPGQTLSEDQESLRVLSAAIEKRMRPSSPEAKAIAAIQVHRNHMIESIRAQLMCELTANQASKTPSNPTTNAPSRNTASEQA